MSSNRYGFTCHFDWNGRRYNAQIVYVGARDDSPHSLAEATSDWESTDPTHTMHDASNSGGAGLIGYPLTPLTPPGTLPHPPNTRSWKS